MACTVQPYSISYSLELVTCMLLLGIELREPLANNAIDLIGLLKLSPVGSGQSLRERRQIARTEVKMVLTCREWSGKKSNEWSNLAASSISATWSCEILKRL